MERRMDTENRVRKAVWQTGLLEDLGKQLKYGSGGGGKRERRFVKIKHSHPQLKPVDLQSYGRLVAFFPLSLYNLSPFRIALIVRAKKIY